MSLERNTPRPDFDRSRKNNGAIHSICLHCLATVATASSEAEVNSREARHLCPQRQEKLDRQRAQKKIEAEEGAA